MADVSEEIARQELHRFFEAMDIDVEESELDEDDNQQLGLLVRSICSGNLSIDEDGQPVYRPKTGGGEPITFYEPTGASYMAMDKRATRRSDRGAEPQDQTVAKMFRVMADMTKTNVSLFANMKNRDLKVCMAIASIFLAQ